MMRELSRNDDNRLLRVEIYETRKGIHKIIGTCEFTIKEVAIDQKTMFTVINKKILAGTLEIKKCYFVDRYTFLDYIHGGCEVSLMVAMDFTMTNKPPSDPASLHFDNPDLRELLENPYYKR